MNISIYKDYWSGIEGLVMQCILTDVITLLEMERVFASASAFANNPQKLYIRIDIHIRGCCRLNLRIDIRIRTLSAINIRIRIRIRTRQRRMRDVFSI